MKSFPAIKGFDKKAEDQSGNFKLIVEELVQLKGQKLAWTSIEAHYKASEYNQFLAWNVVYKEATKLFKERGGTPLKGGLKGPAATVPAAAVPAALTNPSIPVLDAIAIIKETFKVDEPTAKILLELMQKDRAKLLAELIVASFK